MLIEVDMGHCSRPGWSGSFPPVAPEWSCAPRLQRKSNRTDSSFALAPTGLNCVPLRNFHARNRSGFCNGYGKLLAAMANEYREQKVTSPRVSLFAPTGAQRKSQYGTSLWIRVKNRGFKTRTETRIPGWYTATNRHVAVLFGLQAQ